MINLTYTKSKPKKKFREEDNNGGKVEQVY